MSCQFPNVFLASALGVSLLLSACVEPQYAQATRCGGIPVGWFDADETEPANAPPHTDAVVFSFAVTSGGDIIWQGQSIDLAWLEGNVRLARQLIPSPEIVVRFREEVACDDVEAVRRVVDRAANCRQNRGCGEGMGSR